METIKIAAAVILDHKQRMLVVRKRGSRVFIQPSGKIEAGETPEAALERELLEELGMDFSGEAFTYMGTHSAPAANEKDAVVTAELYLVEKTFRPKISMEIEAYFWIDPTRESPVELAPLTGEVIVPLVCKILSDKGKCRA